MSVPPDPPVGVSSLETAASTGGATLPSAGRAVPIPWIETPLIESAALSRIAGCRIFLKLDNLQPSGSFKSRNIGNYIRSHVLRLASSSASSSAAPIHFYTSSGGNAGLAAVLAARQLGYPCTVVVPTSTKPFMVSKLRTAGAVEVVQVGATWRDADRHLREAVLAKDKAGVYVPPFDAEECFEASAGIVDEVERQLGVAEGTGEKVAADVIICAVGGGGLFSGLARGIERSAVARQAGTRLIASETLGADSLYQSVQAKERITLPGITSIATSLGAVQVCQTAFDYAMKPNVLALTVSDRQAVDACRRFADDERILVEPSCGAALAVVYQGLLAQLGELRKDMKVVVEVCGGANVSLELLDRWKREYELGA